MGLKTVKTDLKPFMCQLLPAQCSAHGWGLRGNTWQGRSYGMAQMHLRCHLLSLEAEIKIVCE